MIHFSSCLSIKYRLPSWHKDHTKSGASSGCPGCSITIFFRSMLFVAWVATRQKLEGKEPKYMLIGITLGALWTAGLCFLSTILRV